MAPITEKSCVRCGVTQSAGHVPSICSPPACPPGPPHSPPPNTPALGFRARMHSGLSLPDGGLDSSLPSCSAWQVSCLQIHCSLCPCFSFWLSCVGALWWGEPPAPLLAGFCVWVVLADLVMVRQQGTRPPEPLHLSLRGFCRGGWGQKVSCKSVV